MRHICTGLLAAALVLGLLAAEPAQAKVYKMAPEERAAALKEKKAKRAHAKKSGKDAPGQGQGGWVEVKPGEKIAKKNRKSKVDEVAKAAEQKGKKSKKARKEAEQAAPVKAEKKSKKAPDAPEKAEKKSAKGKKAASEEIVVEKKGAKAEKKADRKADKKSDKKSGRKAASHGDRLVGRDYSGERKVSAASTEVRRPGGAPADDLSGYSVSRPGQEKAPAVPEVRQEVQPGPLDSAKPVGTEHKAGEGRF